jgi:hypothetical protein
MSGAACADCRIGRGGVYQGLRRAAARPVRIASLIVMRRRREASTHDVGVRARRETGIGVAEVLGDLVERPPFVKEQRCAGVAEVVAAEVGNPGALERWNPDAAAPVLPTQVAALTVGKTRLPASVDRGRDRARRARAPRANSSGSRASAPPTSRRPPHHSCASTPREDLGPILTGARYRGIMGGGRGASGRTE